jgi:hypothetical protein
MGKVLTWYRLHFASGLGYAVKATSKHLNPLLFEAMKAQYNWNPQVAIMFWYKRKKSYIANCYHRLERLIYFESCLL